MEKVLKLYTYVDGVNDTPFPSESLQVLVTDFRCDYKRMGGAPTISCSVMHPNCLDKLWTYNVYALFNGERFFIKQIPTSSYDNTDFRYKHELELVSERIILDNVYFYDVVDSEADFDKPVSNSSSFAFFGDIHEFTERLNESLAYSKVGYSVVVDDGISSEAKLLSFQDQFFTNVLQEIYNTYEIPYYFVGKIIHIGFTDNVITNTFKYGDKESLLSIQKQNANYKIVNRVTGIGSEDNIPYYYPNDYESKDEVEANGGTWIQPQKNLMPSIYRESLGYERFYKALNNTYQIPDSNEYYEFENPYIDGKPKEHIVKFDDIKPTIVGMTNAEGLRIDMFSDFAFDANDNDEFDEEGNYLHPYFFGKLRKFDGEYGFNLFDHSIEESEMVISMTSGSCGACEFIIGVDDETQKNIVQVDKNGNLLRDSNGNVVRSGSPQEKQNDTKNNEVWVALKKDQDTFGILMPNSENKYRPQAGDTFVILHIDLPKAYILAAEDKLKEELIKYMSLNNSEKFNFSISFSRIFFAENLDILEQLNENARIQIEYDNTTYELYISSYSYSMSKDIPLPEIRIELSDTLTISQNALQTAISDVKSEILSSIGGYANVDILKQGLKYFLRKDKDDTAKGVLSFDKQIKSSDFVQGDLFGTGWSIYKDSNGNTVVETDRIVARKSLEATELVVNQETFEKGSNIFVKGGCTITKVEIANGRYRCYYNNEEGRRFSGFKVGDQARCQRYNASYGGIIKYYWRLVTGVEEDYVELSMTDCDGTGIPEEGDDIAQLGSRYDKTRQSAIVISPDNGGSVIIWAGIDSFDLSEKNMVGMGVNPNTGRAYLYGYGDMFFGDRSLEKNYITYQTREGDTEPTLNINADIHFGKGSDGLSNLSEFKDIQNEVDNLFGQIEREFTIWYYDYEPTLDNEPAVNWVTDADKALHDQDIFFSDKLARAWRFVNGAWVEITDERTLSALKLAEDAHAAAAEAEKNAREAKEYIDNILPSKLEELQNQIDGAIESFFYKYDPTTSNEPASLWTTEEQKAMHLNDTFTNLESGYSWRWTVNGGVYGWTEISDTATVKALVAAGQAQDTADQKRRVFVATPYTPYDEGDLWVQGETGDILRCSNSRASGNFDSSDWVKASKYTDDSALQSFIENDYKAQLASIQSQMDKRAETWYQVEDPSLAWTTQELKQLHAGDLWYNINKGLSYMWSGNEWVIQGVPDEVFDTIDGKASIYTSQPSSYKKNDLWILASDTTLDKAYKSGTIVVAKQDSDTFVASHWTKKDRYTDDSSLETFLNGAYKEQLEAIQSQIDSRAETWYQSTDPSLQWTTDALKQQHVGDLWYDINKAQSFMWNGSEWVVQGVPDEVYDKIDGKSSIYTSQPSAYKKNDLWILTADTTLDKAYKSGTIVVAKQDSDVFVKEHWTKKDCYTDDSAVTEFINGAYKTQIDEIKGQIDKKSETWYQNTDPSLNWDTTQKNEHKGDLWYNTNEDQTYIWSGTIWIPQGVPDEVFDKIDGKAQIFVSRPNSYNRNDLWILEGDMTLDKDYKEGTIVIATTSSNYFNAAHWTKLDRYTDDSRADEAYGKAEEAYRKAESFSEDLTGVLADMEIVMNQVDREFTIWYYNHVPTLDNAPAVDWDTDEEKQRHDQDICFSDELARAWRFVDGQWVEITDERTLAVLKQVEDLEYLKNAFGSDERVMEGGIIVSTLVSVRNKEGNLEAFINGSEFASDTEHGKLIIAGGIPDKTSDGLDDLQARSKEATTRVYEDGSAFFGNANISGSFNSGDGKTSFDKDGSGQLANGNIKWDSDGTMWKKSPEYIVWRRIEEEYEAGDTIDLQGGSYLDITAGVDYPEYTLPLPETDKTIAVRYILASRSDAPAMLGGSFNINGIETTRITIAGSGRSFDLEYNTTTGKWHYYGYSGVGYFEKYGDVVVLLDKEEESTTPSINGLTKTITIHGVYGEYELTFESGLLTGYKYNPTEGGN